MLNPGDPGLLRSVDRLAAAVSAVTPTGSSVAAMSITFYGLSLMNHWSGGEHPFA